MKHVRNMKILMKYRNINDIAIATIMSMAKKISNDINDESNQYQ